MYLLPKIQEVKGVEKIRKYCSSIILRFENEQRAASTHDKTSCSLECPSICVKLCRKKCSRFSCLKKLATEIYWLYFVASKVFKTQLQFVAIICVVWLLTVQCTVHSQVLVISDSALNDEHFSFFIAFNASKQIAISFFYGSFSLSLHIIKRSCNSSTFSFSSLLSIALHSRCMRNAYRSNLNELQFYLGKFKCSNFL